MLNVLPWPHRTRLSKTRKSVLKRCYEEFGARCPNPVPPVLVARAACIERLVRQRRKPSALARQWRKICRFFAL